MKLLKIVQIENGVGRVLFQCGMQNCNDLGHDGQYLLKLLILLLKNFDPIIIFGLLIWLLLLLLNFLLDKLSVIFQDALQLDGYFEAIEK